MEEQIVLKSAKSGGGREIVGTSQLGDLPRLEAVHGPGEWVKMEYIHIRPDNRQINVHWFRNKTTGQEVEFKFKFREADKVGNIGRVNP